MLGGFKDLAKKIFRKTGFDIVRAGTFDSLVKQLQSQRQTLEERGAEQSRHLDAYKRERSLIPLRPECYQYVKNSSNVDTLVFRVGAARDFDWLEDAILRYGYYEKPNIWSLTVDADKRALAEMLRSFEPKTLLDIGCANGPLLQALEDLGIAGEGVEISSYALEHAFPAVKSRIHHGDLLGLALADASFDVISGLDIFEHLNPNRIDAYIAKMHALLKPGGLLFANIPAFGKDEVFGEVFEYYLADWEPQRGGASYFKTIHVDMHGYPVNGHLVWADTRWWAGLFEKHGFRRDTARETALHRAFDDRLFYARRSFYVFQKTGAVLTPRS